MSKIRVVIADDNELMLDMISTILKNDDDIEVVAELTDGLNIMSVIEESFYKLLFTVALNTGCV